MTAAIGVLLVGIIFMCASVLRLPGPHSLLFVAAVWALSSASARFLIEAEYIAPSEALAFTGTLSFAVAPICLWILWRAQ